MSRFNVGQTYCFVRFHVTNSIGNTYWSTYLFNDDTVHEIQIIQSQCISQQDVKIEYREDTDDLETIYVFNVDGHDYCTQYSPISNTSYNLIKRLDKERQEYEYRLLDPVLTAMLRAMDRYNDQLASKVVENIEKWLESNGLRYELQPVFPNKSTIAKAVIVSK
jgi:hypothetical protein